ncbi:hypothetical protein AJ80_03947 [Polytolypa hystricis UAMH7299]|uniref:PH domain-containing protein n=1 Tax=Polytolypa hystricis (strain UAMH7299) TaxID=1447883 RepID=A0A2B7YD42_POLH7|nr:hypothetical protein AJ80_03947 [Polytolypa hystricis UAMH7299]
MSLRIDSQVGGSFQQGNQSLSSSPILRNGQLNLDTFSPVNRNGSFAFDQVLMSGKIFRRRKSKHAFKASWKPGHLVLRPNLLSLYKDEEEVELRLSITLSDVTAVALVKPPGSKRENTFGIYTPSKNYRFQASSQDDAELWVECIRNEFSSESPDTLLANAGRNGTDRPGKVEDSASEMTDLDDHMGMPRSPSFLRAGSASRRPTSGMLSHTQDYSGNEITSYSDFSDVPVSPTPQRSTVSLPKFDPHSLSPSSPLDCRPSLQRQSSQTSDTGPTDIDLERVICHGYLLCLKSKKGVRQWKKLWVVLRPHNLYFYKDEQEYSAVKIISMDQIINAAEIDPMSRSKNFCLQIIAEDRTYRFCAPDEEALAKWLGSLKSVLVKKDQDVRKSKAVAGPSAATATTTGPAPLRL